MKNLKSIIKYAIFAVSILLLSWMFISWIDIIADNTSMNPSHYDWNFFIVTTK